jgi:CRISPR-associated protein Cas1
VNYAILPKKMLTLPDFKEKQILFVQGESEKENFLRFQNDNILYKKDGENIDMISCYKVFAIFITGDFSLSTVLIRNCQQYGIALFLLKNNFQVYAQINPSLEGNYLLREKQYNFTKEFEIAKKLIKNKSFNQLLLLKEQKKNNNFEKELKNIFIKIDEIKSEKELLGVEGNFSKYFFNTYFNEMDWLGRLPRTKYDINNTLLDIGYTFLFNFIDALVCLYGFDTYKGFYHKLFFQRKSLICDLVEPFRCLIDRQLLKSFNLGQIIKKDFEIINGKYVLKYENQKKYLRLFFDCILKRKEDIYFYIKDYYYFMMDNNKEFPFYKFK